MTTLTLRRLASGGVITNYHCVSRCGHCLYNCSPRRDKSYLGADLAEAIFQRVAAMGCRSVHVGGGEPLLSPEKLYAVLDAARRAGIDIDYVETNAAWFTDAGEAAALLEDLAAAGVHTLLVSISPFHNAHIPFDRVKGVIAACRQNGMNVFPWVNAFVRDLSRLDEHRPHAMVEFEAAFGPGYLQTIPDRYWIHPGGRALETFRPGPPQNPLEAVLTAGPVSGAQALKDPRHFHIDLYGNYIPGLCAGLAIAMQDLGSPLPSGKYPLLDRLAADGIRGLLDLAVQTHGFVPGRNAYLNHCDLCTDIRQFLMGRDEPFYAELAPAGFYDELPPLA